MLACSRGRAGLGRRGGGGLGFPAGLFERLGGLHHAPSRTPSRADALFHSMIACARRRSRYLSTSPARRWLKTFSAIWSRASSKVACLRGTRTSSFNRRYPLPASIGSDTCPTFMVESSFWMSGLSSSTPSGPMRPPLALDAASEISPATVAKSSLSTRCRTSRAFSRAAAIAAWAADGPSAATSSPP